jgi:hypothetical protein
VSAAVSADTIGAGNVLETEAAVAIADALVENRFLKELSLGGVSLCVSISVCLWALTAASANPLGDRGMIALCRAMCDNKTLQVLSVSGAFAERALADIVAESWDVQGRAWAM